MKYKYIYIIIKMCTCMWLFMHTQECNVQIPSLSAHKFMFKQAPLLKMLVL